VTVTPPPRLRDENSSDVDGGVGAAGVSDNNKFKLNDNTEESKVDVGQAWRFLEASFYGTARALVGLPLEHPFDCIKTVWQANPSHSSVSDVIRHIYQRGGVSGFYVGIVPNGLRAASKQLYRWPLMLYLPTLFHQTLHSSSPSSSTETSNQNKKRRSLALEKTLTGFSIATIETFAVCPLERLKVWMMSSHQLPQEPTRRRGILLFVREAYSSSSLMSELFRGLNAVYARQIVSWVTFLVADDLTKTIARKTTGQEQLSFGSLFVCSCFVGALNTATTLPFDVVKTHLQKDNPSKSNKDDTNKPRGVFKSMIELVRKHNGRVGVLYTGWRIRLFQYCQSLYTVTLLDRLQASWEGVSSPTPPPHR